MVRIALAQVDCELGEVDANFKRAREQVAEAGEQGAQLVVFPELSLHGYALGRLAEDQAIAATDQRIPELSQDGAEVLFMPTNSAAGFGPESLDTIDYWGELLRFIASMQQCWVVFVNRVGTECGARFWGGSRVIDPGGEVVAQSRLWDPELLTVDIDVSAARRSRRRIPLVAEARLGLIERELRRIINDGGDA